MIATEYSSDSSVTLYCGDCLDLLYQIKDPIQLVITSPPYNIQKEYETKMSLNEYLVSQERVISACVGRLSDTGSICWQVGHYIEGTGKQKEAYPLDLLLYPIFKDLGLKLRNRIVWTFGFGLHDRVRFSGRHETILWFTKTDDYVFNLDAVRVPQKYPFKKYFKGKRAGELSGNPLGKNPGDVWDITNVKNNHPEKTKHPCQFPTELVRRLVLSLSNVGDLVVDPYMGSGTTAEVCIQHDRRVAGADIHHDYVEIARNRCIDKQLIVV